MSKTIDERVVEMRFDNSRFEKNIQQSMGTLDKLKQSLNLNGAAKGLENINSASKRFDLSHMGNGVENIRAKFSALEVVGVTALVNIANSAVNAGKRIIGALTIEPITTGFNEYETKINSIQTILSNTASKGETMKSVTKVIDELNTYADKTIYNFAEMTRNIGTFTAAGVGLKESASAIQGIANLAAASGSSSQQASTAMYQLSQALAAGTVKLQDWNSVVNAGMGGEKFQEALKQTAREHGVAVDKIIKDEGSFRDSLQKGWITADILNETLNKFTVKGAKEYAASMVKSGKYTEAQAKALIKEARAMEDAATKVKTFTQLWDTLKEAAQSGWGKTWEIIVGDFNEAKGLFTDLSKVLGGFIDKTSDARNKVLEGWKKNGGRDDLLASFKNIFDGILSIVKPIKEVFREIFPKKSIKEQIKGLTEFTKNLKEFTSKMKLSSENAEKIKKVFKGVFSAISIGIDLFKSLAKGALDIAKNFSGIGQFVLNAASAIGEWITSLKESTKKTDVFGTVIGKITKSISSFIDTIKSIGSSNGFTKLLDSIWNILKKIGSKIGEVCSTIGKGLAEAFKTGDIESFANIVNKVIFSGLLLSAKKFIDNFLGDFVKSGGGILDNLKTLTGNVGGILDSVRESLQIWQSNLKASLLLKIASAIAVLTLSLVVLSGIDEAKLSSAISAITMLFIELVGALSILNKTNLSFNGTGSAVASMISIAFSVLILASALKKVSDLDTNQLETGLLGIAGLAAVVVVSARLLSSSSGKITKGAMGLNAFAIGIKILASVCKELSEIEYEKMKQGLTGVGILMGIVDIFLNTAKTGAKTISTAIGITILAGALKILETSVSKFGNMNFEKMKQGLIGIGALLAELSAFTRIAGGSKKMISTALSITILGGSLKIIESVLERLAKLSWDGIARGLVGIGGALGILTAAAHLYPKNDIIELSTSLPIVTSALIPLAEGLEKISKISWPNLVKGLVTLGASMVILAVGLNKLKGTLVGSMALFVAASALTVMATAIKMVSGIGIMGVVASLTSLAGVFIILGIAAKLLGPLSGSLLAISGSIVTLGLSFIVLGAGLAAIGTGLVAVITSIVTALLSLKFVSSGDLAKGLLALVGIFAAIGIAATVLKPLIPTILSLSGSIALLGLSCIAVSLAIALMVASLSALSVLGEKGAKTAIKSLEAIIVGFFEMIPKIIPSLFATLKELILGTIDVIVECVPALADGFLKLFVGVLDSLVKYGPKIIDLLITFVLDIVNGLAARMPEIIAAVVNLLGSIFDGVMNALKNVDTEKLEKAILSVGLITVLIRALASTLGYIPSAMAGLVGVGIIISELALILAAIGGLAQIPGLKWLINEGGDLLQSVGTAIGKFIGGIVGGFTAGATSGLPEVGTNLSKFMMNLQPFIVGCKMIDETVINSMTSLVKMMGMLAGNNIKDWFASKITGDDSMEKFGIQLSQFADAIVKFSKKISGNIDESSVTAAANAGLMLSKMQSNIQGVGGVFQFFTGEKDLAQFGVQIQAFGRAIVNFSKIVADNIDEKAVKAAANAGAIMAEMQEKIAPSGGVVQWFTGEKDMALFGSQLVSFGYAIVNFSKSVSGEGAIDEKAVKAAANAGNIMSKMQEKIVPTGGVVQWFTGEKDMALFGSQLVSFGYAIVNFSKILTEGQIDEKAISAAANAGTLMTEMQSKIVPSGGVIDLFAGEQNMADFGSQIVAFGEAIVNFSEKVSGKINSAAVLAAGNAGLIMAKLQEAIPEDHWFDGKVSLDEFGEDIADFGEYLADYGDAISSVEVSKITASLTAAERLVTLAQTLTGIDTSGIENFKMADIGKEMKNYYDKIIDIEPGKVSSSITSAGSLVTLCRNLIGLDTSGISDFKVSGIGKEMKTYSDKVAGIDSIKIIASVASAGRLVTLIKSLSGIDTGGVSKFTKAVNELGKMNLSGLSKAFSGASSKMLSSGSNITESLAKGMGSKVSALTAVASTIVTSIVKKIDSQKNKFLALGIEIMGKFASGISKKSSTLNKAFTTVLTSAVDTCRGYYNNFYNAGSYVVSGFANGISSKTWQAEAKATEMAKAAVKAARKELKINSPSKVFMKIGGGVPEGFAKGINKFGYYVTDSIGQMSKNSLDQTKNVISNIASVLDTDIDTQPTIRPVVDLSDVKASSGRINGLFGQNISLGVSANSAGVVSAMMSNNSQNGNEDIVSAINKLRKELGNVGGTTYKIDGITYDDGSNITNAVKSLVRAAKIERRI